MRMPELWIRSLLPADGFALPLRLVFLGCRRALVGFDVNFNLSALFQLPDTEARHRVRLSAPSLGRVGRLA
jgi:hypothetical protein